MPVVRLSTACRVATGNYDALGAGAGLAGFAVLGCSAGFALSAGALASFASALVSVEVLGFSPFERESVR